MRFQAWVTWGMIVFVDGNRGIGEVFGFEGKTNKCGFPP